jgi:hypothetical protein
MLLLLLHCCCIAAAAAAAAACCCCNAANSMCRRFKVDTADIHVYSGSSHLTVAMNRYAQYVVCEAMNQTCAPLQQTSTFGG